MRTWVLALLFLVVAPWTMAGDYDVDTEKTLSQSCGLAAERVGDDPPPAWSFDEPIDERSADLGFYPPKSGTVSAEKAAGETCQADDPPPEEPYDKDAFDDTDRIFAPCAFPAQISVDAGLRDNYALPIDPANLTPAIINAVGPGVTWTGFDSPNVNRHFGHTFQPNFQIPAHYQTGLLTIYLRPLGDYPGNDTISLWVTGAAGGWGASLPALGVVEGRETILQLDLRTLSTGTSTILADVRQFGNLNVYIQDDTAVDSMTLQLSCSDNATPAPLVGVVMSAAGCGRMSRYEVFLDDEDHKNANDRRGWIGAIVSDKNTLFRVCATDGRLFTAAANAGANFALVSLSPSCPAGFTRFDRYHDNEDHRPASWDNTPAGSPTVTVGSAKNTNMAFCVATGSNPAVPNSAFPDLGVSYGVFAGKDPKISPWALNRGWVYLDDEDDNNKNQPKNPPAYTFDFLEAGKNTRYYLSQAK